MNEVIYIRKDNEKAVSKFLKNKVKEYKCIKDKDGKVLRWIYTNNNGIGFFSKVGESIIYLDNKCFPGDKASVLAYETFFNIKVRFK